MAIFHTIDEKFQNDVILADRAVLLDVWADWCGPCLALSRLLDKLAEDYQEEIHIVKLNADNNPKTVEKYRIKSLPTLMLFQQGRVIKTLTGLPSENKLRELIENNQFV